MEPSTPYLPIDLIAWEIVPRISLDIENYLICFDICREIRRILCNSIPIQRFFDHLDHLELQKAIVEIVRMTASSTNNRRFFATLNDLLTQISSLLPRLDMKTLSYIYKALMECQKDEIAAKLKELIVKDTPQRELRGEFEINRQHYHHAQSLLSAIQNKEPNAAVWNDLVNQMYQRLASYCDANVDISLCQYLIDLVLNSLSKQQLADIKIKIPLNPEILNTKSYFFLSLIENDYLDNDYIEQIALLWRNSVSWRSLSLGNNYDTPTTKKNRRERYIELLRTSHRVASYYLESLPELLSPHEVNELLTANSVMGIKKVPFVTSLLREARSAGYDVWANCLETIMKRKRN